MGDFIVPVSGEPESTSVQSDSLVSPLLSPRRDGGNYTSPTSLLSRLREYLGRYITPLTSLLSGLMECLCRCITFLASLPSRLIRGRTLYKKLQPEENRNKERTYPWTIVSNLAVGFAIYEKAASLCGNLVFIWATVVLLGGFATTLETRDFRYVTILLLLEGVRIFCRSSEVTTSTGPTTLLLFCIQILSASLSIAFSSHRLSIGFDDGESDINNRNMALRIFYYLCEIDAALILLEKFGWMIVFLLKSLLLLFILENAGAPGLFVFYTALVRYFYAIYCRCINESIFEGSKMEFISYNVDLLQSSDADEQLTSVHACRLLSLVDKMAEDRLIRTIETKRDVLEILIEMLKWKSLHEQAIRKAAAQIVSSLVSQNQNHIRVAAIAGSVQSIVSLLYDSKAPDNLTDNNNVENQSWREDSDFSVLSQLGLKILISLASDDANCAKIGRSEDLLPTILRLTELNPRASQSEIDTARLALQLVKMLASSTGPTGEVLRKQICDIGIGNSNLFIDYLNHRQIISMHGSQIVASIDKLTRIAVVEETRRDIGGTEGVLPSLFSMFFNNESSDAETKKVVFKAGEALALLLLESTHNCRRMMDIKLPDHPNLIAGLISALDNPVKGFHVARILRNLYAYAETDYVEFNEIVSTSAQVFKFVMEKKGRCQEAAIGLAAQILHFKRKLVLHDVFKESDFEEWSGVTMKSLIRKLVEVFRKNPSPSKNVPNIRRFSMELMINVMKIDRTAIKMRSELEAAVQRVKSTVTEKDDYSTYHGNVGLIGHPVPFRSLVEEAFSFWVDDDNGLTGIASLFGDDDSDDVGRVSKFLRYLFDLVDDGR